jgi:hypothetical protein
MTTDLLPNVERLRRLLEDDPSQKADALSTAAGFKADDPAFWAALRFLDSRHEIVLDAVSTSVHLRRALNGSIVQTLESRGPMSQADLRGALALPVAVVAEAVGWLEREGRVEIERGPDGDRLHASRGGAPRTTA